MVDPNTKSSRIGLDVYKPETFLSLLKETTNDSDRTELLDTIFQNRVNRLGANNPDLIAQDLFGEGFTLPVLEIVSPKARLALVNILSKENYRNITVDSIPENYEIPSPPSFFSTNKYNISDLCDLKQSVMEVEICYIMVQTKCLDYTDIVKHLVISNEQIDKIDNQTKKCINDIIKNIVSLNPEFFEISKVDLSDGYVLSDIITELNNLVVGQFEDVDRIQFRSNEISRVIKRAEFFNSLSIPEQEKYIYEIVKDSVGKNEPANEDEAINFDNGRLSYLGVLGKVLGLDEDKLTIVRMSNITALQVTDNEVLSRVSSLSYRNIFYAKDKAYRDPIVYTTYLSTYTTIKDKEFTLPKVTNKLITSRYNARREIGYKEPLLIDEEMLDSALIKAHRFIGLSILDQDKEIKKVYDNNESPLTFRDAICIVTDLTIKEIQFILFSGSENIEESSLITFKVLDKEVLARVKGLKARKYIEEPKVESSTKTTPLQSYKRTNTNYKKPVKGPGTKTEKNRIKYRNEVGYIPILIPSK